MKIWVMILAAALGFSARAQDTVASLCAQGVEGSFEGSTAGLGLVHVNLFCLDSHTMMATLGPLANLGSGMSLIGLTSFSHVEVVDGQLEMTDFDPADRPDESSKGETSILHADLAALKAGKIHGDYMRATMPVPVDLDVTRSQTYATFSPSPTKISAAMMEGVFTVNDSPGGPDKLIFDMADDIPVIYYECHGVGDVLHLLVSGKWDGSGLISIATPEGNGGEGDDKYLYYLRGHVINGNEIEFYLISPAKGAQGPMHATRTSRL